MQIDIESVYSFRQIGERDNQEDSRYPDEDIPSIENAVFVVCDGVGGSNKGEVASATVCRQIGNLLNAHKRYDAFTDEDFAIVLEKSYKALDDVSDCSNTGMGTTLAFICIHSDGICTAHIGDSRIYQIRPNEGIIYRSEDHSVINSLLRSGNISPERVREHPKSNIITRCMSANGGTREKDDATVVHLQDIAPGDFIILCTDGVTGCVEEDELVNLYSSGISDKEKYECLLARCANSADNNTAIQIHIGLVTVDVEKYCAEVEDFTSDLQNNTVRLNRPRNAVHEVSASSDSGINRIKLFIKTIFK